MVLDRHGVKLRNRSGLRKYAATAVDYRIASLLRMHLSEPRYDVIALDGLRSPSSRLS
jgi:hypothetical protein